MRRTSARHTRRTGAVHEIRHCRSRARCFRPIREDAMKSMAMNLARCCLGSALAVAGLVWPVLAQEVLPRPEPPFKGVIGETYKTSTPDKIPLTEAPEGAPNVLVILIDDSGFGQWSTFGGLIPTPNL